MDNLPGHAAYSRISEELSKIGQANADDQPYLGAGMNIGRSQVLHVKVLLWNGQAIWVDVGASDRVRDVKQAISQPTGVPDWRSISIIHDGHDVEDDWLAHECLLSNGNSSHTVHAGLRASSSFAHTTNVLVPDVSTSSSPLRPRNITRAVGEEADAGTGAGAHEKARRWEEQIRPEERDFHHALEEYRHKEGDSAPEKDMLLWGYEDTCHRRLQQAEVESGGGDTVPDMRSGPSQDASRVWQLLRAERNTWRLVRLLHQLRSEGCVWDADGSASNGAVDTVSWGCERAAEREAAADGALADDGNVGWAAQRAVEDLVKSDPVVRLFGCLKSWLEQTVAEPVSFEKCGMFGGEKPPWPATLSALKKKSGGAMVNVLDPDALSREGKLMDADDMVREASLINGVWQLVRAGDMQGAKDLCHVQGQPWRAAILSGGALCHSNLYSGDGGRDDDMTDAEEEKQPEDASARVGNPFWFAWKEMCWRIAENPRAPATSHDAGGRNSTGRHPHESVAVAEAARAAEAERAVHAALSGHLRALLQSSLCGQWEDQAWAYACAMIEFRVDRRLEQQRERFERRSKVLAAPKCLQYAKALRERSAELEALWSGGASHAAGRTPKPDAVVRGVFSSLRNSSNPEVCAAAKAPFRRIQVAIAEGWESTRELIDNYLADVCGVGSPSEGAEPHLLPHLLRFGSHLVLYLSELGQEMPHVENISESAREDIIAAYATHLIRHRQAALIPQYVVFLSRERRIALYAQFLQTVEDVGERRACLALADNLFPLDVSTILRDVARLCRTSPLPGPIGHEDASADVRLVDTVPAVLRSRGVSATDCHSARGVQWLCIADNRHRAEAIVQTNALVRSLLLSVSDRLGAEDGPTVIAPGKLAAAEWMLLGIGGEEGSGSETALAPVLPRDTEAALADDTDQDISHLVTAWETAVARGPPGAGEVNTWYPSDEIDHDLLHAAVMRIRHNSQRELLGWTTLLEAQRAYDAWRTRLAASVVAPRPEPNPTYGTHGMSRAKSDVIYVQQVERHVAAVKEQSRLIIEAMQDAAMKVTAVLEFAGGWLMDEEEDTPNGSPSLNQVVEFLARGDPKLEGGGVERLQQLEQSRAEWLPTMANMLHETYAATARWMNGIGFPEDRQTAAVLLNKAIQVADTIADEHMSLYKVFDCARMDSFLSRIHSTSLALCTLYETVREN